MIGELVEDRARSLIIINAIGAISIIYKAVSFFLPENTLQKVQVTSANSSDLLEQIAIPEQIEEQYGGKAPNRKEGEYWPPRLPSTYFGQDKAIGMAQ